MSKIDELLYSALKFKKLSKKKLEFIKSQAHK